MRKGTRHRKKFSAEKVYHHLKTNSKLNNFFFHAFRNKKKTKMPEEICFHFFKSQPGTDIIASITYKSTIPPRSKILSFAAKVTYLFQLLHRP